MKPTCTIIDLSPVWDDAVSIVSDLFEHADDMIVREQLQTIPVNEVDEIVIISMYLLVNNLVASGNLPLRPVVTFLLLTYINEEDNLFSWFRRSLPDFVTASNLYHCEIINRVLVLKTRPEQLIGHNIEENNRPLIFVNDNQC